MLTQTIDNYAIRYELGQLERNRVSDKEEILTFIRSGLTLTLVRDTVLPTTVPMEQRFFWLNRQASGLGDILYASMQKSNGVWAWFQVIKAT